MAMQYIERELRKLNKPGLAGIVSGVRKELGHDIVFPQSKEIPRRSSRSQTRENQKSVEFNLDAEWKRQAQDFITLGFHRERGFDDTDEGRQAYIDTLAKFKTQPEGYKGRLDRPMLIEYQIPWTRQRELARTQISDYFASRLNETHAYEGARNQVPEGTTSYTGWFNKWGEGDFSKEIAPRSARENLAADTVGGNMYEAVAQQIHFPQDNVNSRFYDIIGEVVESGGVPCLLRWNGRPRFDANWDGSAHPYFRPLVRGGEIVTRQLNS